MGSKKLFFVLWFLCLLGSWAVLPYVYHVGILPPEVPFFQVFLVATLQAVIVFGVVCWLSYLLVPRTDLFPFATDQPLKRIVYPGIIGGVVLGIVLRFLDAAVFQSSQLSGMAEPPVWTVLLASVYGGINEEVLLRLFLFTLVYFLFKKIFRFKAGSRLAFLWMTSVLVAIIFGISHLPAAFRLVEPSFFEVSRVLVLNAIPGIALGWLYWSRGLWTAMAAHFVLDLVVHLPIRHLA